MLFFAGFLKFVLLSLWLLQDCSVFASLFSCCFLAEVVGQKKAICRKIEVQKKKIEKFALLLSVF